MSAEQAELYLSILCLIFHVQSAMGNAPLGPDWRKADIMSKAKVGKADMGFDQDHWETPHTHDMFH